MPGRGPLLYVNTALRSPFGFLPICTALGAPARNTTSHSLMPSATPPLNNVPASLATGAGAAWLAAAGAGADGTAGGGQEPLAATRSLAVIDRRRSLLSCKSENV